MQSFLYPLLAIVLLSSPALGQTRPTTQPSKADLEKRFEQTMSGSVLVGRYTDSANPREPQEDRYTITKATKAMGENWIFFTRMQFGGKDVTLPIMLPVKWAGDTPVITVTDITIPGLGTYTARVMIHNDQYAGTWAGRNHGGHMWGRIERMPPPAPEEKK